MFCVHTKYTAVADNIGNTHPLWTGYRQMKNFSNERCGGAKENFCTCHHI